MTSGKRLLLAKIRSAHGIKGLVKVEFYGEDVSLLEQFPLYTSEDGEDTVKLTLKNQIKTVWLSEIDGVTDKTQADTFTNTNLYLPRENLPELEDGKYYHVDLIGRIVKAKEGHSLGKVISIDNFGASDLIEIKAKGKDSFYVPYTDDFVLDITDEHIIIDVPELI